jgi:hypothetical protein
MSCNRLENRHRAGRWSTLIASISLLAGLVTGVSAATAAACTVGDENLVLFPAGGKGTQPDPYLIDSQAALINSNLCRDVYLLQTQDITLTGTWMPLGDYDNTVSLYDGGGHVILGLRITNSPESDGAHTGLWSRWQNGGSVKNMTLVNPLMTTTNSGGTGFFVGEVNAGTTFENIHVLNGTITSSSRDVGGLIGNLSTESVTVSKSSVDATITSTSTSDDATVGGLVGRQGSNSLIQQSSSSGAVSASASITAIMNGGIGGLVGYSDGRILNTYSTMNVTATSADNVGGLIGRAVCDAGDLNDSYSIGVVSGRSGSLAVGGLVGQGDSASCNQSDSVWDTQTSGQLTSAVGTGRETSRMQAPIEYTSRGWSTSIWFLTRGAYPTLVAPGVSISPTSLDLGSQGVLDGTTVASTTTVTSNGTGPLTIYSPGITISGTHAADFAVDDSGSCADGASLAVSATCTVAITFDPSSTGAKSATLTVATDAGNQTVALSGTGIASTQTVTWSPTISIDTSTTSPSALATSSGDGAMSYAVSNAGTTGCTVDSSTAALTFAGAGSCEITATAAATSTYAVASTTVTFSVSLTPQPITVSAASSTLAVYSSTTLSTSGVLGSGQVTYSESSSGAVCSLNGSTLTATGVGTCAVTASVAADATYATATSSSITITVQKAIQTVTWSPTNTALLLTDSPVTPSSTATTDGDGAITYSVTDGSCTVDSDSGMLTYSSTGNCEVTATAASTATYAAGTKAVMFAISAAAPAPPIPALATPPTAVTAVATDGAVTVSWEAPITHGSFPVTDYQVSTLTNGETCLTRSMTCVISGLTNGDDYTFRVRALTGAGWSDWSQPSNTVTPGPEPVHMSMMISGSRDGRAVRVVGSATGMIGVDVTPMVRMPGQTRYAAAGNSPSVLSDGSFSWQRRGGKKMYVYFRAEDDVRSNRIIIPARR